ncbi:unnamed protein product [Hermetia illucens]|uniref:Uncharacterized protein n=1 Tax=Hermetia illucens TaxID=343691 RepID=A0A7R8YUM5_HERIL|nr:unnamed protein product [Hermetia illucens]
MYESSCSYQTALDLKRVSPATAQVKTEDCIGIGQCSPDWTSYRFHQSTFEQLKQSVEKAKAALQDRTGFFGTSSAFSDIYTTPRLADSLESVSINGSAASCIVGVNSPTSSASGLVVNGNCITTVSGTTGQRYRIDSLPQVSTNNSVTSSLAQTLDAVVDNKNRSGSEKSSLCLSTHGFSDSLRPSTKCGSGELVNF